MKFDADVIVVGAGPSGAMVSSEIALAGVSVIALERRTSAVESRAGTVLPRVLELLDARGIADRFVARMNAILDFPFRPEHIYAGLKFVDWKALDSRYGFTLGLPQNHTEELLLDWCREVGAEVRFGHEVTGLEQKSDHVAVEVQAPTGTTTLRAKYVVGADGGRSPVRHALGLPFDGHGGRFSGIVADAEISAPWPMGSTGTDNAAGWFRGFAFGKDLTRFNMVHHEAMKKSKDMPVTVEEVTTCLRDIAGEDFGVKSLRWASRYDDTMRVVPRLREGRVFLVGESARIHYPASGIGMNFCLQDAFNLGWKLAAVCKGQSGEALLDSYDAERMPVIRDLCASVNSQCALQFNFTEEGVIQKRLYESNQLKMPDVNAHHARELNGIVRAYEIEGASHPLAGRPVPDLDLVLPDGTLTRIGELLRDQCFLLLDLTGTGAFDNIDTSAVPVKIVKAIASRRIGESRNLLAMLIRPDAYVAWASDEITSSEVASAELRRWLSSPLF